MIRLGPIAAFLVAAFTALAPLAAKPVGDKDPWAAPALADAPSTNQGERILSFRSDILVNRDSSLDVTETIRVLAQGQNIRRGIYRDFPTRYQRNGRTVRVGFSVASVQRDGRVEPWSRESISNGVRVRIGDADVMLPTGEHVYVIRYTTTRQLGFFPNYDELYWNVTGNDWMFAIDSAEARIRLPQPVALGQRATYTGPQGSTSSDAQVVAEHPGDISFRTTRPLGPREGFTVAVAWPKNVVTPPPPPSAFSVFLERHGALAAAIFAFLALGGFYYYAWLRAGRGPIPGTVVPLFEPPEGMSAAAVRFVRRMGFDNRAYAAAIVESGVKGKIRLVEEEGGFFSRKKTRIEETADGGDLPTPERTMLRALFAAGPNVEMEKSNHRLFGAARSALDEGLTAAYKGKLFLTNKGWAWAGMALMVAMMLLIGAMLISADPFAEPGAALVAWAGFGLMLTALGLAPSARRSGGWGWLALAGSVLAGLAGCVCLIGTLGLGSGVWQVLAILAPLLTLPLIISAFWWMAAPTREGRAVMDRIAGFQRYLSVTEENRLEVLHPPEKTPELFERFLPYAIALGVENRWADRFAGVLAAAAADPNRQGSGMAWYVGSQSAWSNPSRFVGTVGGALASSVAAASTAPGSSSGSGGGGSSGGGGGGGGGGGW